MTASQTDERTTVIATYSTRRDAEVARDYLDDADIRTFVSTDDAGGMHPQMQRPHGVKLVGLEGTAQQAYDRLQEADLLPSEGHGPSPDRTESASDLTFSLNSTAGVLGAVALLLLLLAFFLA